MLESGTVRRRDDVTGNGAGVDDERPRGFEPDRMRRLWSDIDHARDNLGLGPEVAAADASSSGVAGVVGYAVGLAADAAGAVANGMAGLVRGVASALPDPRRLVGAALPCVRRLPIVGTLFD
jgi:hypothetical protein